ncbi:MAG: cell division protein FtsI, partial [Firmicutes bacterium]|nr:cell division protein FtsI [Bacillota bacterium]
MQGRALAAHPYNRRLLAYEREVLRGTITDRRGEALARSEAPGTRVYPKGRAAAPVVGYLSERY